MRCRLILLACCAALFPCGAAADELRLDAAALFENSTARGVRLDAGGKAVTLDEGELIEDDGPAAGYSYLPNEERLSDRVRVKKELIVPDPAVRVATLLVAPGGDLKASINGKPVELKWAGKAGNYWQAYAIPPGALKAGKNEIVLHGSGRVWIARAEDFASGSTDRPRHPQRSARSGDGGKSWHQDRLGPSGDIAGEYHVRLHLDHHRSAGSLTLPVLDAGNLAGRVVAPPLAAVGTVSIRVEADAAKGGRVAVRVRSGTTPVPNPKTWSDWGPLRGEELREPKGRYVQLTLDLSTSDPLKTPRLKGVRVTADPKKGDDWAARLKVLQSHNEEVVRSAVPFAYEPFDHPRLKRLRKEHDLDEVVKSAKDELGLMTRLASWSAGRWERGHLKEGYPPWDALKILERHRDGKPVGGFCQQYNVVFLQACQSFGIPGRAVSIGPGDHSDRIRGGHEVVELWSNQFRKWVYIDGNEAWYLADAASDVPLSLRELRERQLRALAGEGFAPVRAVELAGARKKWGGLTAWPPFLELRLIPRSNFLEEKAPLPLNQGMRGWFWTGHHAWTDDSIPASVLYDRRVRRPGDWDWTLNQARFTLEATGTRDELLVHLDTQTPGFDTFLADVDGKGAKAVGSGFTWRLKPGKNRLEVRPRNVTGREGAVSRVVIERP